VEHEPWVGKEYSAGINGQHIAVMLHLHYFGTPEEECVNFTTSVIEDLSAGKRDDRNLVKIQNYFGACCDVNFWSKVIFFNFLPNCIGTRENMRGHGTRAQKKRAEERFLEILFRHKVEKVFVFTRKGWKYCPRTRHEESTNDRPLSLGNDFPKYDRGTYSQNGHTVEAFGLEHPERARADRLMSAVQFAMTLPKAK
jgi:hypothetical protein